MDRETRTNNLYACAKCGKFHVLFVDINDDQTCPNDSSVLELVTGSSDYYGRLTPVCLKSGCKQMLKIDGGFINNKKCDQCKNTNSVKAINLIVNGAGVVTLDLAAKLAVQPPEPEDHTEAGGEARRLLDKVRKAENFTSSHHKNKSGSHTANASATHDRGDRENAQIRQKKADAMQLVLEKLKESDGFDERKYRKLIARVEKKIDEFSK